MAGYKISLYLTGDFKREQISHCFEAVPSLYLEKGDKNSGGRVVKTSICDFVIKRGETDYLTPVFDECLEQLNELVCGVMKLRELTSFQSLLSLVIRTDNLDPMPNFCLSSSVIELLCKSKTEFDLDGYHYETRQDWENL